MKQEVVLIFDSVHYTLKAEACLKLGRWSFLVVPMPPAESKGCGLGIQIDLADHRTVVAYLEQYETAPLKSVIIGN